ncbi:MAG TPA: hypothetical protein VFJ82_04615 [Longimicrobium sp.]|nr:hypothetical protein [Longimicrobium sp.]
MQQLRVREVMPPLKSKNITLAQAKRAWLEVMREEREAEEQKRKDRGGDGSRIAPEAEV